MNNFRILVVDDDPPTAQSLSNFLERRSFSVTISDDGIKALEEIKKKPFDVILLDINLPRKSGIDILREVKEINTETPVIMMTAYASVETAVSALRLGATDYITKPFEPDEIFRILDRLVERKELIEANEEFSREAKNYYDFSNIVTQDPRFLEILDSVKRVSSAKVPMIIMGESGTGKELVARAVHTNSERSKRPLIAVNCAAISPTLMESEFFGHIKGAFTTALSDHKGYFERAHKSTLFLDEIGELPLDLQAKLLRVLQEGQINRVGDSRAIDLDFRLIAATQRDLNKEVEQGRFRKDLFYRLSLFTAVLPPLRERPNDIPPLVRLFLRRASRRGMSMSDEAMEALVAYDWPGNVRELENVIERAVILAKEDVIKPHDLPLGSDYDKSGYLVRIPTGASNYKEVIKTVSDMAGRDLIIRTLLQHDNNISRSAGPMGVSRRFLTYKLKDLGIKGMIEDEEEEQS